MTVLGIETSTAVCSVGLVNGRGLNAHTSVLEAHIHSEKLLTLIQNIAAEAGVPLRLLDAVAVSIGPGSFTGLRIGLSSAKGLCYAFDKPLVTVPTLQAIAAASFSRSPGAQKILVALDAKKGDYYAGLYASRPPETVELEETTLVRADEVRHKARSVVPDIVVTDRPDLFRNELGDNFSCLHVHEFCRGDVVAELGLRKAAAGQGADLAAVEPLYLKDFVVHGKAPLVP